MYCRVAIIDRDDSNDPSDPRCPARHASSQRRRWVRRDAAWHMGG